MNIGEKIRAIRKEKGMTQKQLADICKMADSAIRKYESGQVVPKMEMIERIANALEVPAAQLMNRSLQIQMESNGLNQLLLRVQEKYRLAEQNGASQSQLDEIQYTITSVQELLRELSSEQNLLTAAEHQAHTAFMQAEALSQQHTAIPEAVEKKSTATQSECSEREENSQRLLALFDKFTTEGQRTVLCRIQELSFVPGLCK